MIVWKNRIHKNLKTFFFKNCHCFVFFSFLLFILFRNVYFCGNRNAFDQIFIENRTINSFYFECKQTNVIDKSKKVLEKINYLRFCPNHKIMSLIKGKDEKKSKFDSIPFCHVGVRYVFIRDQDDWCK